MGVIEAIGKGDILLIVPLTNINTTWLKNLKNELPQWEIHKEWNSFKSSSCKRRIFLVHYEGLKPLIKKIQKHRWDLVTFDESQRLKKRSTAQSRLGLKLNQQSRRLALSGTPMDGDPIDLWAQFRFIEPMALGTRWADFESRFLRKTGFMGYKREFIPERLPQFMEIIKPYSMRIRLREVLPTPEPEVIDIPVELFGNQRKLYDQFNDNMVAFLDQGQITADLVITQILRLQQITGGFVKDDEGNILKVGEAKLRKIKSLFKKLDPPVVVFCRFTAEVEAIAKAAQEIFPRVGRLHGSIKDKKNDLARSRVQENFQAGLLDVLICQQKTGGVGIDLFRSNNAIFYSMGHSYIDFDQAKSRLDRRGQSRRVSIFLIRAINTIDDDIIQAILSKRSVSNTVLSKLKRKSIMTDEKKAAPKKDAAKKQAPVKKTIKKPTEKKKNNLPTRVEPKYGVNYLCEKRGIQDQAVRIALRKAGIEKKPGNVYGWDTKAEADAIYAKIWPEKGEKKAA